MMRRYSEYKDSGVKWIGLVPEHWSICRLKYLSTCNDEALAETYPDESIINYVEIGDVTLSEGIKNSTVYQFGKAPSRARRITRENDVIISTVRTYLQAIATVNQSNLVVSTGFAVIRPTGNQNAEYLSFALKSKNTIDWIVSESTGISYPAITANKLNSAPICTPPLCEQQAIVSYLDDKIAKIDQYIAVAEKKIKALEELKQTIISDAVTHGINPHVKMKDSGIKWVGMIPEHWGKNKIQRLFSFIGSGTTPKGNQSYANKDNGIPWINSGDLNYGYLYECSKYVTPRALQENSALKVYPKGTLLIAMYGASIGKYAITRLEGCTNQACCALSGISSLIDLLFASYLMRPCKQKWIEESFGGTQPNISAEKIKQTWLPLPPLPEQQAIVSYLDRKVSQIEQLRTKELSQIEKLKEYKQRLISDVVTGKVKVIND